MRVQQNRGGTFDLRAGCEIGGGTVDGLDGIDLQAGFGECCVDPVSGIGVLFFELRVVWQVDGIESMRANLAGKVRETPPEKSCTRAG